ncbi:hypothetical protein FQN57_003028 [Myotisia sp. PD_48]|nr:hypothetical protein FQN57_003028 [Myotisia sp. PD_48]
MNQNGKPRRFRRYKSTLPLESQLTLDLMDLSEFPTLASQQTNSSSGQAIWGSSGQRTVQQNVSQRQQSQAPTPSQGLPRVSQTQSQQSQQSQSQPQSHPSLEDQFPSTSQFATRLDDFRNGVQAISGQLSGGSQPQTGNIEEFPPLGKNPDGNQERRDGMLQGGATGTYGGGPMGFSSLLQGPSSQIRSSPLGNSLAGLSDSARLTSPASNGTSGRSPIGQAQNGTTDLEDMNNPISIMRNQQAVRSDTFPDQQQGSTQTQSSRQQQSSQQTASFDNETQPSGGANQTMEQTPLSQMNERDRFGLAGLLAMIHSDSPDVASLAIGQDLMSLGLDLNQPEPLHQTFASPFISSNVSVPLRPEFTIPACYNVANVQPLQSRIPSFSDETLFYIFYSMPRDIMQELVAEELMGRKWRYHKIERAWLTRDDTYPSPVEVERGISERGVYLWWDTNSWKKTRRDFILRYADLDNRLDPGRNFMRGGMTFPQST